MYFKMGRVNKLFSELVAVVEFVLIVAKIERKWCSSYLPQKRSLTVFTMTLLSCQIWLKNCNYGSCALAKITTKTTGIESNGNLTMNRTYSSFGQIERQWFYSPIQFEIWIFTETNCFAKCRIAWNDIKIHETKFKTLLFREHVLNFVL